MAIYSCSISNVSRAKGSSACATLSYITGEKVFDERLQQTFSFGRRERVVFFDTVLPEWAPEEYKDPKVLFNEIETYEKADNARTAKKIIVALPRELSLEQSKEVLEDFIRGSITKSGYATTFAIHDDPDHHNPHAHILIANRQINERGEWASKRKKEYLLDEKGERVPIIDPKTGEQKVDGRNRKQWKRIDVERNPLDQKAMLQEIRSAWAKECNRYLDKEHQIDHRSNADRGIELEPTIHEGYAAGEIVKRGGHSEIIEMNQEIKERNSLLERLWELMNKAIELLDNLFRRKKEQERDPYEPMVEHLLEWMQGKNALTIATGTEWIDIPETHAQVQMHQQIIDHYKAGMDEEAERLRKSEAYKEAELWQKRLKGIAQEVYYHKAEPISSLAAIAKTEAKKWTRDPAKVRENRNRWESPEL